MKKVLLLSSAFLFFAATSHAQSADTTASNTHKDWHKNYKSNDEDFYKKMNFTDAQKTQLKSIKQDEQSKEAAIKSNSGLPADQKKTQLKAARDDAYQKRQAVYTPAQKEVIKEDRAKRNSGNNSDDNNSSSGN